LEAAGDRGGEEPFDRALALLRLAAEGEFAVDDGAADAALGVVVGQLDAVEVGEGPQRRPALKQVAGELAVVLRLRALACRLFEQCAELVFERADSLDQVGAIAALSEPVPGLEQAAGDREAGLAERLLGGEPLAVGGEVPNQVRPTDLAPFRLEVVVRPPAIRAGAARRADGALRSLRPDGDLRQRAASATARSDAQSRTDPGLTKTPTAQGGGRGNLS
jgi:hypothetical protein